jgi:lambda repressor-like predicted transcriptional regulator
MEDNIATNNMLIAKFMGIKVEPMTWKGRHTMLAICDDDGSVSLSDCDFYYPDSMWGDLIPVVSKINNTTVRDFYRKEKVMNTLLSLDIKKIWQSVVDFIQWYNS